MNLYSTLAATKRSANVSGTSRDALWLERIEAASRAIDLFCGRHFYTVEEVRYFDGACRPEVWVDDYLSITALGVDSERDGTFDGQSWVEGTDWVARPYNAWPKIGIEMHISGRYGLVSGRRYIKATGTWGYGDGFGSNPWTALGVTGSLDDGSDTSLTLSVADGLEVGQTIRIESEQLYVSAVEGTTVTVVRGVNGTTAAAHVAAAVFAARYPAVVVRACATLAASMVAKDPNAAYKSERIGDYQYTLADDGQEEKFLQRALCGLVRPV